MAMNIARSLGRARYAAQQGARVAWYMGHYYLARRLSGPIDPPGEPKFTPKAQAGDRERIRAAFFEIFARDRANIEAGLYPAPEDEGLDAALSALRNSARFFSDLPRVDARRRARRGTEVRQAAHEGRYPSYYLQNFHYQTGGWLTRESASLYDTQVEVLFGGAADAMRRMGLAQVARALKGTDQRGVSLIDVGCGNGRFMAQILAAFPRLKASGVDLSAAYCADARERLARWPRAEIVMAAAEATPFATASFDAATSVYLFHELPPRVRREAAREIARIVKPGGVFVFVDSVQTGDTADLDRMLEYFPIGFHEPYYASYLGENLPELFAEAGFTHEETDHVFLTKVLRLRRSA